MSKKIAIIVAVILGLTIAGLVAASTVQDTSMGSIKAEFAEIE
jgi:type III secretory pathway component EscS